MTRCWAIAGLTYALYRHPDPENTNPISFRGSSLGEGCLHRDRLVSPGHRMCIDDVLVTALEFVNGASGHESPDVVEYKHIELDRHDVILADGVQTKTYQDVGDRNAIREQRIDRDYKAAV